MTYSGASMYSEVDYKSKKTMKEAIVARGNAGGVYNPGLGDDPPANGMVTLEGHHYPKPHTWYARVQLKDGLIVKVLK
jgi:hypothetical protein